MLSTRNHLARIVLTFMTLFVMGCSGGGKDMSQAPPIDDTRGGRSAPSAPAASPKDDRSFVRRHPVITLVGAAAAYYMYKKHQNASAQATGPDSQYYLSKNGRVYYRDANHQAHWVTPPPGGIQVPEDEARDFQGFEGYNNQPGRDLTGLGTASDR